MLYAILCYGFEDVIGAWTQAQAVAAKVRRAAIERRLEAAGRLGPAARLLPTTAAVTLRKGAKGPKGREVGVGVVDGPFARTQEQLVGFHVVDCDGLEAAITVASALALADPGRGAYEIRPVDVYRPGALAPSATGDSWTGAETDPAATGPGLGKVKA